MRFIPRIKLNGRRAAEEQITQEISSLIHGKSVRPYPLSVTETAKLLGVCRGTVYNYLKRIRGNELEKTNTGRYKLPKIPLEKQFRQFNKFHEITSDPLVAEWMDDLITRKGGEPLKRWKTRMRCLESVCNTCHIHPSDLLVSQRNTEKILRNYAQLASQGKYYRSNTGRKASGVRHVMYHRVQAVRDFSGFYGMTWRRGVGGIMSQKVVSHGQYADTRLTSDELEKTDSFIKERWGLDSDIYRWFWIGIESCARFEALYNMTLDYTTHINPKTGKTVYVMSVFESKTEHIRGGKWFKYITRTDTQKSIDLLRQRGGQRIHGADINRTEFKKMVSKSLAEIFTHLGKTNPYFFHHPTHSLRHIGAQYWLAKKDYNYGLVAEIGGWHTIDELKKSYGMIPPEKILEIIEN